MLQVAISGEIPALSDNLFCFFLMIRLKMIMDAMKRIHM